MMDLKDLKNMGKGMRWMKTTRTGTPRRVVCRKQNQG